MNHLTGPTITRLMSANHKTISGLAAAMNITQVRVRQVRAHGVRGSAFVTDWLEALGAESDPTGEQALVREFREMLRP